MDEIREERDIRDPLYGIGYKYNKRVIIVDPKGVATMITIEQHREMTGKSVRIKKKGEGS